MFHFYTEISPIQGSGVKNPTALTHFFDQYLKLILLAIVPVLALNGWLWFRRLGLNLVEHFIVGGFSLLGMLTLSVFFFLLNFLNECFDFIAFGILEVIVFGMIMLFPVWSYGNLIRHKYKGWDLIWRIPLFYIGILIQFFFLITMIILALTPDGNIEINM